MTGNSKLCILKAAIAWVVLLMGLRTMRLKLKCNVSLLTRGVLVQSISAQSKQLAH